MAPVTIVFPFAAVFSVAPTVKVLMKSPTLSDTNVNVEKTATPFAVRAKLFDSNAPLFADAVMPTPVVDESTLPPLVSITTTIGGSALLTVAKLD